LRYEDFEKIKYDTDQIMTRKESISDTPEKDRFVVTVNSFLFVERKICGFHLYRQTTKLSAP
jgi:hypothetical protein